MDSSRGGRSSHNDLRLLSFSPVICQTPGHASSRESSRGHSCKREEGFEAGAGMCLTWGFSQTLSPLRVINSLLSYIAAG